MACHAAHPDRPEVLCSLPAHHTGQHQAYYRDTLHEWPQPCG